MDDCLEGADPRYIKINSWIIIRSLILLTIRLPLLIISIIIAHIYMLTPNYIFDDIFYLKMVAKLLLMSFNINVKVKNYKKNKNYNPKILVSNHTSLFDHFIFPYVLNEKYGFLMGETSLKAFLTRHSIKRLNSLAIKKKDTISSIKNHLSKGNKIIIFPEGRINNGKYIIKFKSGAFIHNEDIQPVLITSDSFFYSKKEIENGKFSLGSSSLRSKKIIKNYLIWYLFRMIITPKTNVEVNFLPIFKKEDYCDNPVDTADKVRDLLLKYDSRLKKL